MQGPSDEERVMMRAAVIQTAILVVGYCAVLRAGQSKADSKVQCINHMLMMASIAPAIISLL